ncbi:SRPBCC family protein [Actinomadura sp. SCN-SB]|uniref:SRPBCC family protein n=1 Tax=Actinomadura sp. SCN-SB TaxID=3373092 RepID=UPI003751EA96
MELDHEFTVPVPVDQAWSVLLDVERVASCMPGATLDSVDGEEYSGRMRVKVGAMTITYRGTARITSADESSRTITLEAAAKEARGSGTASATVVSRLHPVPAEETASGEDEGGSTRVTVRTKLDVTGRPAQFGRNILSEVGAKLITRFATELAARLESEPAPEQAAPEQAAPEKSEPETATAEDTPKVPRQRQASAAESTSSDDPVVTPIRRSGGPDDAIDLLEVAGPSVAKRAVPALAAVLALVLVVRFLVRRRRGS